MEKNEIKPMYEVICGDKTDRACCWYDKGCRLEGRYYPSTGLITYPGRCCM